MNNIVEDEVNEIPLRSNFLVLLTINAVWKKSKAKALHLRFS